MIVNFTNNIPAINMFCICSMVWKFGSQYSCCLRLSKSHWIYFSSLRVSQHGPQHKVCLHECCRIFCHYTVENMRINFLSNHSRFGYVMYLLLYYKKYTVLYNWKRFRLLLEETVPRDHAITENTFDSHDKVPVNVTCIHVHVIHLIDDLTNQVVNVLPCNMHVVHPWWECYYRLTSRVTFPGISGEPGRWTLHITWHKI